MVIKQGPERYQLNNGLAMSLKLQGKRDTWLGNERNFLSPFQTAELDGIFIEKKTVERMKCNGETMREIKARAVKLAFYLAFFFVVCGLSKCGCT